MSENVAEAKAALRSKILSSRTATRSHSTASDFANGIMELVKSLGVKRIGCYLSMESEPSTEQFLKLAQKADLEILVPKIVSANSIGFAPLAGKLKKTALGFFEPSQPVIPNSQIELLIIPALAVDELGNRLGRGGGYFDRFLEDATALVAAVVYEVEILPEIPSESHDRPVNFAITEKRIISFR